MKRLRQYYDRAARFLQQHQVAYAWCAVAVLAFSTIAWATLSARLQQGNADQLVDGFLFQDSQTFHQALFPASHTLLFKWPLFWLLGVFHYAAGAYIGLTVLLVFVTVGGLAYILHKIVPSRLLFGALCLTLASVLVLVPAQLFDGVTAPVNLAMITGRNIEYVVYIGVLIWYIQASRFWSWRWVAATVVLAILFASDQLFISLSVGGALVALPLAYTGQRQRLAATGRWLIGSILAVILAKLLLSFLNAHVTHIVGDASPYSLSNDWQSIWPAVRYACRALLLHLGITTLSGPIAILPSLLNTLTMILAVVASVLVVRPLIWMRQVVDKPTELSILLLASSIAAFAMYVFTTHPYVADVRYIGVVTFTGFVALAVYIRRTICKPQTLLAVSVAGVCAVILGLVSMQQHTTNVIKHDLLRQRDQRIAQTLQHHPVTVLVGDYWRVIPIRSITSTKKQTVIPLRSCLQPSQSLRSQIWQTDLRQHSFAYVLSLRATGTAFPLCNLQMIQLHYGRPTATQIIAGTAHNPQELLLFYDNGADDTGR